MTGRSNLVYLKNRHYNPNLGTFTSVDPLVESTHQPYLYGAANPVRYSDPTGLEPRPIHCRTCSTVSQDMWGKRSDGYGNDRVGRRTVSGYHHPRHSPAAKEAVARFVESSGPTLVPGAPTRPDDGVGAQTWDYIHAAHESSRPGFWEGWASIPGATLLFDGRACGSEGNTSACLFEVGAIVPFGKGLKAAKVAGRIPVSALDDASTAAFRAADNVADFRVPLKHQPGAGGRYARFGEGIDQHAAIRDALTSDSATFNVNYVNGVASDTSLRVVTDLGRVVGSNGQTSLRVVVGNDGRIWTAFPTK